MKAFKILVFISLSILSNVVISAEMKACDLDECKQHFKKYKYYARVGYADAMSAIGEFYYHGYGTEKNLSKALSQLKRAAKYGSYAAPVKVALLRLTEPSLIDTDDAIKYLRKAARYNHPDANFLLGMIYYSKTFGYFDIESSDKHLSNAYDSEHKLISKFIEHIDGQSNLTSEKFPLLISKLDAQKSEIKMKTVSHIKDSKNKFIAPQSFPSDDIEIVTINGPSLSAIFTQQFEIFNNTIPEKNSGSASKIIRRSCEESVGCSVVDKTSFKRMLNQM